MYSEVQRYNGFFETFLLLFSTSGVEQFLGFHLVWSVETLPCEGCGFYSTCLQAVWANPCLGTGLCKGYFGLTHRTCLPFAGGSGISECTYCAPELVFLVMDWAPHALHAVQQELWKFSFGSQAEVTSGAICVFVLSCCPAHSTVREGDSKPILVILRLFNGLWKPVLKEMFRSLEVYKHIKLIGQTNLYWQKT